PISLDRLKFDWRSAPVAGVDIGDGLGEGPAAAEEVSGGGLALAVGIIVGRKHDAGAVGGSAGGIGVDVRDADEKRVRERGDDPGFGMLHKDDGTIVADVELSAMVAHTDADGEAEGGGQPVDGFADVRVGEFWDDRSAGNGTVSKHGWL